MIFGSKGLGKALPQENYGSTRHMSTDREDHHMHNKLPTRRSMAFIQLSLHYNTYDFGDVMIETIESGVAMCCVFRPKLPHLVPVMQWRIE
ncbi:hypothetical protein TNCV_3240991 [Trichonephila clavipes]|nr:hypothetical protein TNCV_3240991 [Trichonephila clavipes]